MYTYKRNQYDLLRRRTNGYELAIIDSILFLAPCRRLFRRKKNAPVLKSFVLINSQEVDDRVSFRFRLFNSVFFLQGWCFRHRLKGGIITRLVQEAGVDKFLEEEFDIAQFWVFDPEWLEHAQIPVLHGQEDGAQMFDVRRGQVQGATKVLDSLRF